jgi:hypothetical protein
MPIGGVIAMRAARFEPEAGAAAVPCGVHKAGGLVFLPFLNGYYGRDGQEVERGGLAEAPARRGAIVEPELRPSPQTNAAESFFLHCEPPGGFGSARRLPQNRADLEFRRP